MPLGRPPLPRRIHAFEICGVQALQQAHHIQVRVLRVELPRRRRTIEHNRLEIRSRCGLHLLNELVQKFFHFVWPFPTRYLIYNRQSKIASPTSTCSAASGSAPAEPSETPAAAETSAAESAPDPRTTSPITSAHPTTAVPETSQRAK